MIPKKQPLLYKTWTLDSAVMCPPPPPTELLIRMFQTQTASAEGAESLGAAPEGNKGWGPCSRLPARERRPGC